MRRAESPMKNGCAKKDVPTGKTDFAVGVSSRRQ
jgi:hypothetical protein